MSVRPELWAWIVERDSHYVWKEKGLVDSMTLGVPHQFFAWRQRQGLICVVPVLDPGNPYPCGGKQEVDHVKDQPRMGKRAPDDEWHLVAMCQNHNTWHPPRKELRQAERAYLLMKKAERDAARLRQETTSA